MNEHLDFLLSVIYDGFLAPEHRADLHKSGLTDETIELQKIRSVPPDMIDPLLGFKAPRVTSAYLIPFPDPRGGWLPHVRLKTFPAIETEHGTIKYLQPKHSGVRIFFPLATLGAVLHGSGPLHGVEGEKKSLSVSQLGLPAFGICGVEGWHRGGDVELHPDLDDVGLHGRTVNIILDGDVRTNRNVYRAAERFGAALAVRGAKASLLLVPEGYKGVDDYLAATA